MLCEPGLYSRHLVLWRHDYCDRVYHSPARLSESMQEEITPYSILVLLGPSLLYAGGWRAVLTVTSDLTLPSI